MDRPVSNRPRNFISEQSAFADLFSLRDQLGLDELVDFYVHDPIGPGGARRATAFIFDPSGKRQAKSFDFSFDMGLGKFSVAGSGISPIFGNGLQETSSSEALLGAISRVSRGFGVVGLNEDDDWNVQAIMGRTFTANFEHSPYVRDPFIGTGGPVTPEFAAFEMARGYMGVDENGKSSPFWYKQNAYPGTYSDTSMISSRTNAGPSYVHNWALEAIPGFGLSGDVYDPLVTSAYNLGKSESRIKLSAKMNPGRTHFLTSTNGEGTTYNALLGMQQIFARDDDFLRNQGVTRWAEFAPGVVSPPGMVYARSESFSNLEMAQGKRRSIGISYLDMANYGSSTDRPLFSGQMPNGRINGRGGFLGLLGGDADALSLRPDENHTAGPGFIGYTPNNITLNLPFGGQEFYDFLYAYTPENKKHLFRSGEHVTVTDPKTGKDQAFSPNILTKKPRTATEILAMHKWIGLLNEGGGLEQNIAGDAYGSVNFMWGSGGNKPNVELAYNVHYSPMTGHSIAGVAGLKGVVGFVPELPRGVDRDTDLFVTAESVKGLPYLVDAIANTIDPEEWKQFVPQGRWEEFQKHIFNQTYIRYNGAEIFSTALQNMFGPMKEEFRKTLQGHGGDLVRKEVWSYLDPHLVPQYREGGSEAGALAAIGGKLREVDGRVYAVAEQDVLKHKLVHSFGESPQRGRDARINMQDIIELGRNNPDLAKDIFLNLQEGASPYSDIVMAASGMVPEHRKITVSPGETFEFPSGESSVAKEFAGNEAVLAMLRSRGQQPLYHRLQAMAEDKNTKGKFIEIKDGEGKVLGVLPPAESMIKASTFGALGKPIDRLGIAYENTLSLISNSMGERNTAAIGAFNEELGKYATQQGVIKSSMTGSSALSSLSGVITFVEGAKEDDPLRFIVPDETYDRLASEYKQRYNVDIMEAEGVQTSALDLKGLFKRWPGNVLNLANYTGGSVISATMAKNVGYNVDPKKFAGLGVTGSFVSSANFADYDKDTAGLFTFLNYFAPNISLDEERGQAVLGHFQRHAPEVVEQAMKAAGVSDASQLNPMALLGYAARNKVVGMKVLPDITGPMSKGFANMQGYVDSLVYQRSEQSLGSIQQMRAMAALGKQFIGYADIMTTALGGFYDEMNSGEKRPDNVISAFDKLGANIKQSLVDTQSLTRSIMHHGKLSGGFTPDKFETLSYAASSALAPATLELFQGSSGAQMRLQNIGLMQVRNGKLVRDTYEVGMNQLLATSIRGMTSIGQLSVDETAGMFGFESIDALSKAQPELASMIAEIASNDYPTTNITGKKASEFRKWLINETPWGAMTFGMAGLKALNNYQSVLRAVENGEEVEDWKIQSAMASYQGLATGEYDQAIAKAQRVLAPIMAGGNSAAIAQGAKPYGRQFTFGMSYIQHLMDSGRQDANIDKLLNMSGFSSLVSGDPISTKDILTESGYNKLEAKLKEQEKAAADAKLGVAVASTKETVEAEEGTKFLGAEDAIQQMNGTAKKSNRYEGDMSIKPIAVTSTGTRSSMRLLNKLQDMGIAGKSPSAKDGSLWHGAMGDRVNDLVKSERLGEGSFAERSFEHNIGEGDTRSSMKIDYYDAERGIIVDWKTGDLDNANPLQLALYAKTLRDKGYKVNGAYFVGTGKNHGSFTDPSQATDQEILNLIKGVGVEGSGVAFREVDIDAFSDEQLSSVVSASRAMQDNVDEIAPVIAEALNKGRHPEILESLKHGKFSEKKRAVEELVQKYDLVENVSELTGFDSKNPGGASSGIGSRPVGASSSGVASSSMPSGTTSGQVMGRIINPAIPPQGANSVDWGSAAGLFRDILSGNPITEEMRSAFFNLNFSDSMVKERHLDEWSMLAMNPDMVPTESEYRSLSEFAQRAKRSGAHSGIAEDVLLPFREELQRRKDAAGGFAPRRSSARGGAAGRTVYSEEQSTAILRGAMGAAMGSEDLGQRNLDMLNAGLTARQAMSVDNLGVALADIGDQGSYGLLSQKKTLMESLGSLQGAQGSDAEFLRTHISGVLSDTNISWLSHTPKFGDPSVAAVGRPEFMNKLGVISQGFASGGASLASGITGAQAGTEAFSKAVSEAAQRLEKMNPLMQENEKLMLATIEARKKETELASFVSKGEVYKQWKKQVGGLNGDAFDEAYQEELETRELAVKAAKSKEKRISDGIVAASQPPEKKNWWQNLIDGKDSDGTRSNLLGRLTGQRRFISGFDLIYSARMAGMFISPFSQAADRDAANEQAMVSHLAAYEGIDRAVIPERIRRSNTRSNFMLGMGRSFDDAYGGLSDLITAGGGIFGSALPSLSAGVGVSLVAAGFGAGPAAPFIGAGVALAGAVGTGLSIKNDPNTWGLENGTPDWWQKFSLWTAAGSRSPEDGETHWSAAQRLIDASIWAGMYGEAYTRRVNRGTLANMSAAERNAVLKNLANTSVEQGGALYGYSYDIALEAYASAYIMGSDRSELSSYYGLAIDEAKSLATTGVSVYDLYGQISETLTGEVYLPGINPDSDLWDQIKENEFAAQYYIQSGAQSIDDMRREMGMSPIGFSKTRGRLKTSIENAATSAVYNNVLRGYVSQSDAEEMINNVSSMSEANQLSVQMQAVGQVGYRYGAGNTDMVERGLSWATQAGVSEDRYYTQILQNDPRSNFFLWAGGTGNAALGVLGSGYDPGMTVPGGSGLAGKMFQYQGGIFGQGAQQIGQALGLSGDMLSAWTGEMFGGIGGQAALGWQQQQQSLALSRASLGIQGAQFALKHMYTTGEGMPGGRGFWQIEEDFTKLTREQQNYNYMMTTQQLDLQEQTFAENMAFSKEKFDVQTAWKQQDFAIQAYQMARGREWTREDWDRQDNTRAIQWGWTMEDAYEQIRFSTGRERRYAIRDRDRATISHNIESEQIDVERQRTEEKWGWEDEAFEKQQERHDQTVEWQNEEFDLQKKQFDDRMKLTREAHEEELKFIKERRKLEDEQRDMQREFYLAQEELQKASLGIQAAQIANQETMMNYQRDMEILNAAIQTAAIMAGEDTDLFREKLQEVFASIEWSMSGEVDVAINAIVNGSGNINVSGGGRTTITAPPIVQKGNLGTGSTGSGSKLLSGLKAIGGHVLPGERYLIGENEPEIFVPDVPGDIVPMSRAKNLNSLTGVPDIDEMIRLRSAQPGSIGFDSASSNILTGLSGAGSNTHAVEVVKAVIDLLDKLNRMDANAVRDVGNLLKVL